MAKSIFEKRVLELSTAFEEGLQNSKLDPSDEWQYAKGTKENFDKFKKIAESHQKEVNLFESIITELDRHMSDYEMTFLDVNEIFPNELKRENVRKDLAKLLALSKKIEKIISELPKQIY